MRSFEVGEAVCVAVLALDRASTNDKRVFDKVASIHSGPSYPNDVLHTRSKFSTSELMPRLSTIDLEIPTPASHKKITLHVVAAHESTTDQEPIFGKCKDKRSWCSTRRCVCVKAEVKCGIACQRGQ